MSTLQNDSTEELKVAGKTVIRPDTTDYKRAKSASGAMSQHNGDTVATRLAGFSVEQVAEAVAIMVPGTSSEGLMEKYAHLNVGQQRMALGNRLRGAINKANKAYDLYVAGLGEGDDIIMPTGIDLFNKATEDTREELDAAALAVAEDEDEAECEAEAA